MKYSIVIPIYNEQENLEELYKSLSKVIEQISLEYEIIFIDDGSIDRSYEILKELSFKDKNVKAIRFSRNFGHQIALTAGMDFAAGDCVITMDGDLQHPPELIPEMLDKWKKGCEIVYTIRKETEDANFIKNSTSKFFYFLINKLGDINLQPSAADFKLLDKKVVTQLCTMRERDRMLRGMIDWLGFKNCGIEYKAPKRFAGKTKYNFKKMMLFAIDGITSFSSIPLRLSALLGFIVSFLSFIYIIYVLYIKLFTDETVSGWASILFSVLFIGGIQLITIGIIGEYIGRIYTEIKNRPLYVVTEKLNIEKEK